MKYVVVVVELDDLIADRLVETTRERVAMTARFHASDADRRVREFVPTCSDSRVYAFAGDAAVRILEAGLPADPVAAIDLLASGDDGT